MIRRAVLFDLYNTLLVSDDVVMAEQAGIAAFEATMVAGGLRLAAGQAPNAYADLFSHPLNPKRNDGLTIFEGRFKDFATRNGFDAPVELVQESALAVVTAWQKYWRLDPAAPSVLADLRLEGFVTGMVTNFDHWPHVHTLLKETGLTEFFDHITVSGEVLIDKPDPAIFHLTLGRLGVQPQDAVYIGDHDVDVIGAMAAEIIPVRLVRDSTDEQSPSLHGLSPATLHGEHTGERVITSLEEVSVVVEELLNGRST